MYLVASTTLTDSNRNKYLYITFIGSINKHRTKKFYEIKLR